jgi:hydroxymethylpyrimidine/phosphomethylpyrimidine kinase
MNQNHLSVPAVDMEDSKAFYRSLGLRQIVDSPPNYSRFLCPDGERTLSIERVDALGGVQHVIVYFECDDVDGTVASLRERGIGFESGPADQPWGWREAYLRDPAGTYICLYRAGSQRTNPRSRG